MKITLILPSVGRKEGTAYIKSWQMQPLTMAVLAGLTPPQHEVVFYDDRLEPIPFAEPTDLVAISIETYTARRSYAIAEIFRQRGVPVVAGGFHPTLAPEEVGRHVDSLVIGEAEGVWLDILTDAQEKKLRPVYQSAVRPSLQGIRPRREIFQGKRYLPLSLVEFGRGCRYACRFCSVSAFYQRSYRHRPVAEVVAEVKAIPGKNIFFVDDNITADWQAGRELFQALVPLKKRWVSQCSLRIAEDKDMLRLLRASGCYGLLIGLESLLPANLAQMDKAALLKVGTVAKRSHLAAFSPQPRLHERSEIAAECRVRSTRPRSLVRLPQRKPPRSLGRCSLHLDILQQSQVDEWTALLARIRQAGIKVYATFVFGYDQDDAASIRAALRFAEKQKFFLAAFNHLMPFPGTALYQDLAAAGRLTKKEWWLDPDYRYGQFAFEPVRISAAELMQACVQARQAFYRPGSIFRRAFDLSANSRGLDVSQFVLINMLLQREVGQKFGFPLGQNAGVSIP